MNRKVDKNKFNQLPAPWAICFVITMENCQGEKFQNAFQLKDGKERRMLLGGNYITYFNMGISKISS